MGFKIIITKIINNENMKIIIKQGLKSNYKLLNFY